MAVRGIRQRALEKIAILSATSSTASFEKSDLDRLCKAFPSKGRDGTNGYASRQASSMAGRVPMTIREFEVLMALCKAAPLVQSSHGAQRLTRQLIPYILDSHAQTFSPSPFFRQVEPSPSEALSFNVTAALLALGINHDDVHEAVTDNIWAFLNVCSRTADSLVPSFSGLRGHGDPSRNGGTVDEAFGEDTGNVEDAIRTATISMALLGFLDAAAAQTDFWRSGGRLALVSRLRKMLSEPFLVAVETAFSTIRNAHASDRLTKDWKRNLRHYSEMGRPLGAMLLQQSFMHLLVAATSLLVAEVPALKQNHVLDLLISGQGMLRPMTGRSGDGDFKSVETYATAVMDQMNYLAASADFVRMGSTAQQKLSFSVKASALISYLNCSRLNEDAADTDTLMGWLEETLADPVHMADERLAAVVLKAMALVCRISPEYAAEVSKLLPRYIVQSGAQGTAIDTASTGLASVLQMLSPDAMITTLYTLGNVLSAETEQALVDGGVDGEGAATAAGVGAHAIYQGRQSTGSSISLRIRSEEETAVMYGSVVQAICGISGACKDPKINALAQSMLLQKVNKISSAVDAQIIPAAAVLGLSGGQHEFRSLLKTLTRITHMAAGDDNVVILESVMKARNYLSRNVRRDSALYEIYWEHLLDDIISKGDVHQTHHAKETDIELAAREIAQLLQPLAVLMSTHGQPTKEPTTAGHTGSADGGETEDEHALVRDAWFNIVVHGFTAATERGRRYMKELRVMAVHSPALVAAQRGEQVESDIELNTVLRRGMSSEREGVQKKQLAELVGSKGSEIRGLSYGKVMFLHAAYLVESLRADAGDCTRAISYFVEPSARRGEVSSVLESIASSVVDKYVRKTLAGTEPLFSATRAATQLAALFCSCCHRLERVQQAAYVCTDRLVREVPSALCQRSSLFALLELLSLLWTSCLETETDMYQPRSRFRSARGGVTVELSDDYEQRRATLARLHKKAQVWVAGVMALAPADVKGLLQTYLSEWDDDGAYGHLSLGRSFALEQGFAMPASDQRLAALDRVGINGGINLASDFVAQYTTRQEYRWAETGGSEWTSFGGVRGAGMAAGAPGLTASGLSAHHAHHLHHGRKPSLLLSAHEADAESNDAVTALAAVDARLQQRRPTALGDVRDILRRAAALLCRGGRGGSLEAVAAAEAEDGLLDDCSIVHYLVSIPFAIFTKQSIGLGVSLWLGVIHENPRMQPRILCAVLQQWERSVQRRLGLFSTAATSGDPFANRMDFAPSDGDALRQQQQYVHNLLAPHTRLLQFIQSHFNATRNGSADVQRAFLRMLDGTLGAFKRLSHRARGPHPLARELWFQTVLFGLRVLRHSSVISPIAQWRLKDKLLSAGLGWFSSPPKWTFGSNNLQLKTELRLLSDVTTALKAAAAIGMHTVGGSSGGAGLKSLQAKEQLLLLLLENEQSRLSVWTYPLGEPKSPSSAHSSKIEVPEPFVRTAWQENPALAIQLAARFPNPRTHRSVRWLLLNFPDKAVTEPAAIPILLDGTLPPDVSFQLKYLLFWAPVSPITAATYFLPTFEDHPFLIQYAMRALESHSIDVTFFYVPQIVQNLRYDSLGYVERYILETAQFSQLFAHQIIWNMKANAYKDDDAQIPDAMKPTLDQVMARMTTSFSAVDRQFYEREFSFFDEVTDISGKLKPLIKKSKPEKKQKIEEELRKIKVEVGVYLPSNPDGVVIGIDRKSGKPLQSHAKAPFMATFRIKKARPAPVEELLLADSNEAGAMDSSTTASRALVQANGNGSSPNSLSKAAAGATVGATTEDLMVEAWLSAIFKVGDDCRQDMLALQMISAFRGIFQTVGLDVYVFPYRVTATAPGCGVIDVLPNSVSRDMLGREAVNGLYDYFISKYGSENALQFQAARGNFVKSMAAYSVISFLLQFKDRHNGNIMIDDEGHILHVDFGFCFDIAPGGIKFERAPFKLTSEMLAVMGGSTDHQAFRWFEELCIKAFLAARPYADRLAHIVHLMMGSGLPCFKPESVQHFRQRFVLEKSEREAADFMRDLIKKSYASYSTGLYDQFQWMTNGIPYASN